MSDGETFTSISVQGLDQLEKHLTQLGAELGMKALTAAAKKAFAPVLEAAKARAPVHLGELREGIRLGTSKPDEGDEVLKVGLRMSSRSLSGKELPAVRRWHFAEFGTAHQAAHPFLRPALDENAETVVALFKEELITQILKVAKKK